MSIPWKSFAGSGFIQTHHRFRFVSTAQLLVVSTMHRCGRSQVRVEDPLATHCCLSRRQEGCHLCQRKRPVTFGQVRSARATRVGCRLAVFPVGAQSVSSSRYRVMRLRLLQDACWRRTPALPPPASKATWRPTSTPAPALRNEEGADHSRIRSLRARDPRRSAT